MRRVVIESPFKATEEHTQEVHEEYLRLCLRDSLMRGEAPFASHRMYTTALDDDDIIERDMGIAAGLAWGATADLIAVYADFGFSSGMQMGMAHYDMLGIPMELRYLDHPFVKGHTI